jgi:hypothetical protein
MNTCHESKMKKQQEERAEKRAIKKQMEIPLPPSSFRALMKKKVY